MGSEDGTHLLATHEGLVVVDRYGDWDRVGPAMDLTGFAVAGSERLLASGHTESDADLGEPLGLIESTDGGRFWHPVSRQGASAFTALTIGEAGILGYDGSLLRSPDGRHWEELDVPAPPTSLAASPAGSGVLATTAQGLLRSADGGSTWSAADALFLSENDGRRFRVVLGL